MADSTTRLLDTGARNRLGNKPYTRLYRDYRVVIGGSSILRKTVEGKEYLRNINDDVTSISINYNIDAPPATCDIELQSPRHKREGEEQSYTTHAGLLINDFDEIIVYAKNRFADSLGEIGEQEVFRGIVTRIVDSGTGNDHKISLNCSDLLYWWKIMRMNINPSQINRELYSVGTKNNTKQAIFGDRNPYEIIAYITAIYGSDFAFENTVYTNQEDSRIARDETNNSGAMERWRKRFEEIKTRTFFYGVKKAGIGSKVSRKEKSTSDLIEVTGIGNTVTGLVSSPLGESDYTYVTVDVDKSVLQKFKPYELLFIQGLYEDEYKDRLDIAQEVARLCGFEFFQNTNGLIYFKPPFFNMKIPKGGNPIYILEDIDILNADFSSNSEEVVTEMSVQGKVSTEFSVSLDESIRAFYRDGKLAREYGVQTQNMEVTWIRSGIQALQYAISELDKINSNRFQASITIPGRPELRLGYPIYIPSYDEYWYVTGISHSISPESFTTTITAASKRSRYYHNNQILKDGVLTMKVGDEIKSKDDRFKTFILQGINGVMSSGSTTTVTKEGSSIKMPVSDGEGYDLIGGFPYGRSYSVGLSGDLVSSAGETLLAANVGDVLTNYDSKQRTKVEVIKKPQVDTATVPEYLKSEDTKNSSAKDFSGKTDFSSLG
jgi:hypothetical protein